MNADSSSEGLPTASAVFDEVRTHEDIVRDCEKLMSQSFDEESAAECLEQAQLMVKAYPDLYETNLSLLLLKEKCKQVDGMLESWLEMSRHYPDCMQSQKYSVRWLYRAGGLAEAKEFADERYRNNHSTPQGVIQAAKLYREMREHEKSEGVLIQAVRDFPEDQNARIMLSRYLQKNGKIGLAWGYFLPLMDEQNLPGSGVSLRDELAPLVRSLDRLMPGEWQGIEDVKLFAIQGAILSFRDRQVAVLPPNRIGPTALITGSLAAGGAERQLVNTTVNLERIRVAEGFLGETKLEGPFRIVVTSLDSKSKKDFFLSLALEGGIEVDEILEMNAPESPDLYSDNQDLEAMMRLLPPNIVFGVQRLVTYFRKQQTEIAFVWQDGAVLQAALAALIAGVPRILINFRGMPPNLRPHLHRDEYEGMYKALKAIPGIQFVSNGRQTVNAYCEWIGIPVERFTVVHNGVAPLVVRDSEEDRRNWLRFNEATKDATHTIGALFRFSVDKRPQLWMSFARDYLARHPDARFLIVGGGKLMAEAEEQAESYGLTHRMLFVGSSNNVAFWLQKMDVSVLLSRYEGLPNTLIEAQMAGVPVVSTPAGDAGETFLPNKTGFLLSDAENPALQEVCDRVEDAIALAQQGVALSEKAMKHANETFSIEKMIENTVNLLKEPQRRPNFITWLQWLLGKAFNSGFHR